MYLTCNFSYKYDDVQYCVLYLLLAAVAVSTSSKKLTMEMIPYLAAALYTHRAILRVRVAGRVTQVCRILPFHLLEHRQCEGGRDKRLRVKTKV